ncbi:MAG TPA: hypothetical protein VGQ82_11005, partial [Chthoniobacterales bacterium]|nr:hypothetical protein [Chthoniobacterales bacterium]
MQIEVQKRFHNPKMGGRADGEKFRQPLNDAKQEGQQKIVHVEVRPVAVTGRRLDRFSVAFVRPDPDGLFNFGH